MTAPIKLLISLLILVGVVCLQVYLSRKKSRWPGLVLPAITFIFSVLSFLLVATPNEESSAVLLHTLILSFLTANIPTFVLLAIYFGFRAKGDINTQIEQMNKQDLG